MKRKKRIRWNIEKAHPIFQLFLLLVGGFLGAVGFIAMNWAIYLLAI